MPIAIWFPTGRPGINAAWSTTLLRGLLENPDFRADFINSIACYLNADFKAARARALLQEMRAAVELVMPEQLSRWRTCQSSMTVWNSNVRVMEGFARQRPAAVVSRPGCHAAGRARSPLLIERFVMVLQRRHQKRLLHPVLEPLDGRRSRYGLDWHGVFLRRR